MTITMTARDIKNALHQRYEQSSQGKPGERYICLEEARAGAGFDGGRGQCDFLAINTWQSRGMELIGHEVKVSMSDWKAELAQPEKAERFARFCRRWYIAVPADLAKKIRHEVPPAWGLLSVSDSGAVREVVRPQVRTAVEDVPSWWWVGWLAQIDRQHKRRLPQMVMEGMAAERADLEARVTSDVERRQAYATEALREKARQLDRLSESCGVDLSRAWFNEKDLRVALRVAKHLPPGLPMMLRNASEALAEAMTLEDRP